MGKALEILEDGVTIDNLSVDRLGPLLDWTTEGLRRCARLHPALEEETKDFEEREFALMDFETSLLNRAAQVELHSKRDILTLMDVWSKASGVLDEEELSLADRIVMNIFRHMNNDKFITD